MGKDSLSSDVDRRRNFKESVAYELRWTTEFSRYGIHKFINLLWIQSNTGYKTVSNGGFKFDVHVL